MRYWSYSSVGLYAHHDSGPPLAHHTIFEESKGDKLFFKHSLESNLKELKAESSLIKIKIIF